jgi:transposase-like protein
MADSRVQRKLTNPIPAGGFVTLSERSRKIMWETPIKIRQSKYLNNLIEQDHRAIKRRTRPCWGSRISAAHASC